MGKWEEKAGGVYSCLLVKKTLKILIVPIDPKALFICKNVQGIDGLLYFISCVDFWIPQSLRLDPLLYLDEYCGLA